LAADVTVTWDPRSTPTIIAAMEIIEIGPTTKFSNLITDLASGPLSPLVGSGVSQFSSSGRSSGLPSGTALSEQLARLLSSNVGLTCVKVASLIKDAAFEHIMEACPYQDELRGMLARRFNSRTFNEIHVAIGKLVQSRRIQHVITTNYDLCLDEVFKDILNRTVVTKHDAEAVDTERPIYFKIHGCASQPESLVFTLSGEKRMVPWKRSLLERLLPNRLLVIGYSGRDFEICPELATVGCSIVWNSLNQPHVAELQPSACATRILERSGNTAVVGDMTALIESLGVDRFEVSFDSGLAVPDDEFLRGNSDIERCRHLDEWRCELFRGIGCSRAGRIAADRLLNSASSDMERSQALHYTGLALFHAGKYRQASEAYLQVARTTTYAELRNQGHFDAVEALRCGGFTERAMSLLSELELNCIDESYLPPILVRRLLLLTERVEFLRLTLRKPAAARLASEGVVLADQLEELASRYGSQVELAQCDQLRRRLQLRPSDCPPTRVLLSAVDRFHQLGYVVGKASSIRRELVDGSCRVAMSQISQMPDLLATIGAKAETWKFSLTALAIGAVRRRHWLQKLWQIVTSNLACEYSLRHRAKLVAIHVRESLQARAHI
jgi:hypothetical protein